MLNPTIIMAKNFNFLPWSGLPAQTAKTVEYAKMILSRYPESVWEVSVSFPKAGSEKMLKSKSRKLKKLLEGTGYMARGDWELVGNAEGVFLEYKVTISK